MDRIKISDGKNTLLLLPGIEFTISPEEVSTSAVMASGRLVRDYTGCRNTLTIPTGWLTTSDLALLITMIRTTHELTVTYPTPFGEDTRIFYFSLPETKAFRYGPDGSVWYGVTIIGEESEVDTR